MNFSEESLFQSKNNIYISSANEVIEKPYTSAPKMASSIDYDDLIEIPLSISTLDIGKDTIEKNYHLNTELIAPTICNLNGSPSEQFPESILAVDELLKCSNKVDESKLTMPFVEDGLSSESEVNSPKLSPSRTYNTNIKDSAVDSQFTKCLTKDFDDLRKIINGERNFIQEKVTGLNYKSVSKHSTDSKNSFDQNIPDCKLNTNNIKSNQHSNIAVSSNNKNIFPDDEKEIKKERCKFTNKEYESDEDTDKLLLKQYEHNGKIDIPELKEKNDLECERKRKGKEVTVRHPDYPAMLIEGLLFRANYLGSTQLQSEMKPSRDTRMIQAQEAVGRIKAPDCESQPSVAVDLFVSAEKILVLNTNLSEIMMDHNLKTISYIADIGDILVLMARRISPSPQLISDTSQFNNKILCHVFESDEAQVIAQSIGNAFQIAYIEYLKANGIDDPNIFKEVDYQDVLNNQEILTDELKMFSNKEQHRKVIIPKQRGENLGVVIVESGWGSMLPTVVLANMNPSGPAARCGFLNIGNQIISVNDNSLVGLPLGTCQQIIKKCKSQTAVKLTVVNCLPVVEVNIRRPDSKYQLGFSVQNGVICSLLRGGIAERGGVRVGHHIIEINGVSVVAMSHEKIVNLLATAIGEIHLRTMPTSIFRLLTGQDVPHYI